jgi:hypothetical protein
LFSRQEEGAVQEFEKLGVFDRDRPFDLNAGRPRADFPLPEAKVP